METFDFDYDLDNDDLFIYLEGKKSAGAVEMGNFVLDFDKKGNLVAMQIINVSDVLTKILSKIIEISKIREIKMDIVNFRNMDAIKFSIDDGKSLERANILIPHIMEKSPVLKY
ncbi:DUF2283 domain-containing protein [Candidatus Pacearchaeota archaeon]|nr:DUF2283 domain-containing protein [Candidatus Pacearchaeota archaeon]